MAGLNDYSSTAADNATKGDVNFAEGQAPSTVNDSARALMADLAKQRDDISGAVETTGAAGVYAMTPKATATNQTTGLMVRVQINHDSPSGGCTFNYGAKGAKAIKVIDSAGERDPNANELKQNAFCTMTYDADANSSAGAWIATDIVTAALDASNFALKVEGEGTKASAATCDIGSATEYRVKVTGTTTITSFGTVANSRKLLRFTAALTLTHNATSLILSGGANITTAAGDVAEFASDGSGNWRCMNYERASGKALVVDDMSAIAQDVVPDTDGTRDLGSDPSSSGKAWAKMWADVIGDSNGDEVDTQYVVHGSGKAWANLKGTGTISLRDSLNISSAVDVSTGEHTFNLTNSFADTDYAFGGEAQEDTAGGNPGRAVNHKRQARDTDFLQLQSFSTSSNGKSDSLYMTWMAVGELA
jgi:hypothetical protein